MSLNTIVKMENELLQILWIGLFYLSPGVLVISLLLKDRSGRDLQRFSFAALFLTPLFQLLLIGLTLMAISKADPHTSPWFSNSALSIFLWGFAANLLSYISGWNLLKPVLTLTYVVLGLFAITLYH